jgi:multidrug efflux pump subunit AcrA (membrane-fusion protein)
MEVDIDGKLKAADNALLIPNDAVMRVGDKDIVFVIESNAAHRREVVTGLSNFDYTIVRSGLRQGDRVAVSGVDKLSDGQRVRIVEARK